MSVMSDQDYCIKSIYGQLGHAHRVFEDSRTIQEAVFVKEQGINPANVFNNEYSATHFVLYTNASNEIIPVACARVLGGRLRSPIKIGRVATLAGHRRRKYARHLLEHIIRQQGEHYQPPYFFLNSQLDAQELYKSLNFRPCGEIFYEVGIPHVRMELPWQPTANMGSPSPSP